MGSSTHRDQSATLRGYIEKDVPQPQELVAFGLSMTKRAPISSSVKSITASALYFSSFISRYFYLFNFTQIIFSSK